MITDRAVPHVGEVALPVDIHGIGVHIQAVAGPRGADDSQIGDAASPVEITSKGGIQIEDAGIRCEIADDAGMLIDARDGHLPLHHGGRVDVVVARRDDHRTPKSSRHLGRFGDPRRRAADGPRPGMRIDASHENGPGGLSCHGRPARNLHCLRGPRSSADV